MIKKSFLFAAIILLSFASLSLVSAKVLSKNALIGVSSVVLKHGRSFFMCDYSIIQTTKPGNSSDAGIMVKDPSSPLPPTCEGTQPAIIADLNYIYTNGTENQLDVLLLVNDDLYRPDSTELIYNPENTKLISKVSKTLWKIDPTIPNGQVQVPGQLIEGFDDNGNPSSLALTLGSKDYSGPFIKQIGDTTLLQVAPLEVSPTPGM